MVSVATALAVRKNRKRPFSVKIQEQKLYEIFNFQTKCLEKGNYAFSRLMLTVAYKTTSMAQNSGHIA